MLWYGIVVFPWAYRYQNRRHVLLGLSRASLSSHISALISRLVSRLSSAPSISLPPSLSALLVVLVLVLVLFRNPCMFLSRNDPSIATPFTLVDSPCPGSGRILATTLSCLAHPPLSSSKVSTTT